jgi:hypothetical protein
MGTGYTGRVYLSVADYLTITMVPDGPDGVT